MSGYVSSALRHECSRDGCYQDRLPSWDWMRGCFPRGSMPTDLDGVVEINGHVLFIEQKGRGGFVSGGQARTLRVLEQFPDAAVWLIRQTDDPAVFECIYRDGDTAPSGWHRYTVEQMRTWLRTWSDAAERRQGLASCQPLGKLPQGRRAAVLEPTSGEEDSSPAGAKTTSARLAQKSVDEPRGRDPPSSPNGRINARGCAPPTRTTPAHRSERKNMTQTHPYVLKPGLPPVQCEPWCSYVYDRGHAGPSFREDQWCGGEVYRLNLSLEDPIAESVLGGDGWFHPGPDHLNAYAIKTPDEPVRVDIDHAGGPSLRLTPAEVRQLIVNLQRILNEVGQ